MTEQRTSRPRSKWRRALALAPALAALALALPAGDAALRGTPPVGDGRGGVKLTEIASFDRPVHVAFAPGVPGKLYVVEQDGLVRVVEGGETVAGPFLDLTARTDGSGEEGLLSIAFHPDYRRNHAVYAYYVNGQGNIQLDEFKTESNSQVRAGSRSKVIEIPHPGQSNHNGGQVAFGPGGKLYLATGDGGGAGDPNENAQDRGTLLGKLLRIKVSGNGSGRYRVPGTNPFVGRKGRNEIYAVGLRNPFRFTFDRRTGRIVIGDVGQSTREEIDYETKRSLRGANFGWDRWEGSGRFDMPGDNEARRPKARHHDAPIKDLPAAEGFRSVIAGVIVRDERLSSLYGRLVYSDVYKGGLRSLIPRLRGARDDGAVGVDLPAPSSFGQQPGTKQIHVTSLNGELYRIDPAP